MLFSVLNVVCHFLGVFLVVFITLHFPTYCTSLIDLPHHPEEETHATEVELEMVPTQVNDVIISVDGKSVEGMDLEDIKHLTIGHEGSVAQLVLRRRDETMSVRLQRIQGDMGVLGDYIGQQGP